MKKIGRYDIIEELGRGAMGVVYKASDPTIGRIVAIKVISPNPSVDMGKTRGLELFMREARAAGRLSHSSIVTIYDAIEDLESHSSYIVMEYVRGRTLENALVSKQRFDTKRALEIAHQIAEALDYAHHHNVIHRDLKPANILLTDDDRVKITDFGIAKFKARVGTVVTDTILGTPSHMSPEQVIGAEVGARSDMFALGIILYMMLTGEHPFEGDAATVLFKVAYEDVTLPSQLNPELGPAHDHIVLRCLAKDPKKRYSAREFLDDVENIQQGKPPRLRTTLSISYLRHLGSTIAVNVPPIAALLNRKVNRKTKKRAMVVIGVLFGVVLFAWRVRTHYRVNPSNPPPAPINATASSAPVPKATDGTSQVAVEPTATSAQLPPTSQPAAAITPHSLGRKRKRLKQGLEPAPAASGVSAASGLPSTARSAKVPATRVVHLVCKHQLQEGVLTISSGSELILRARLKGKKKGALLGIKGGYGGILSRPFKIPADAQELSVRMVSDDGSLDLTNTISATSARGPLATLYIANDGPNLALTWGIMHPRPPERPAPK